LRVTSRGLGDVYKRQLLNTAQIQASRLGNTAALFQALGGGWWNKPVE
jgi:hypothetical protein